MKRLQPNCPAQRTSQRPSTLPELPTFSSIEFLKCFLLQGSRPWFAKWRLIDLIIRIRIRMIDSMISVFNADASLPYNRDLFETIIMNLRMKMNRKET
ncbi:hypothetical protein T265_05619 [Opisthorchis viverrini]|uniref:Uncharacterized protein n=1 Tax=Opisthorchis viverrini TaxID=6198 RepID=A0A075AF23_OPIVI|nr:hypothetical protein T265_05619 [Opisthorchis viverrini]KER27294.1 hypothetical protein T265_05619 [Opisthorchis viverrini]